MAPWIRGQHLYRRVPFFFKYNPDYFIPSKNVGKQNAKCSSLLSKKSKTGNPGDVEEIGYLLVVPCLGFFNKQNSSVLTNLNEVKRQQQKRGMENFFQLQHKLWGSQSLKKERDFFTKSLQRAQHYEKGWNLVFNSSPGRMDHSFSFHSSFPQGPWDYSPFGRRREFGCPYSYPWPILIQK